MDIQKRAMIEALEKALGVVTTACKSVGISRSTHYLWMENDPEYQKLVIDLQDVALDFAESRLFKSIEGGSDTATIFYLKTKGKRRGYVERQEITGADGKKVFEVTILDDSEKH
ncbi:MAG: hypothetical protein RLZZ530_1 [Pseudomonadota bacterium]|jgi:hypothetical protein